MGPEHFTTATRYLDHRVDIYGLGIILYEILHPQGRPPFAGDYEQLCHLHTQVPPPPLPQASATLARVVTRCLEKDPDQRYQSVSELLDDLDDHPLHNGSDPSSCDNEQAKILWQQACQDLEQGDFEKSRRQCQLLVQCCPDHDDALGLLTELDGRYEKTDRIYATINQNLAGGNLDELIALLETAVEIFPNHPAGDVVQIQLMVKTTQYRQAMEEGLAAIHRNDWNAAQGAFGKAHQLNPGSMESQRPLHFATALIDEIRKTQHKIDQALAAGSTHQAQTLTDQLETYLTRLKANLPVMTEETLPAIDSMNNGY